MINFKSGFSKIVFLRGKYARISLFATILAIAQATPCLADFQLTQERSNAREKILFPRKESTNNQYAESTPEAITKVRKQIEIFPQIMKDPDKLPFSTKRMRELILEAAISGDIEKLRPLIGSDNDMTMLSIEGLNGDPIDFLKSLSGDEKGHEILAILAEILESNYVLINKGSEHEIYVWPYFFTTPLEKLTSEQKVEMYRLLTYSDYKDMEASGAYVFYRVGITPRGRWRFFVAGD